MLLFMSGERTVARINKSVLTKSEIINEATKQFLENGYSHTTISSICKRLEMSSGNLTFHYPTKEHLLAVLVNMLCDFQWKLIKEEAADGYDFVMAICLEFTSMCSAAEQDAVIKDFFISAYTSPMCLDHIRRNDAKRAKRVFCSYRPEWQDEQFTAAEILVSGIEYATLMTAGEPVALENRIASAMEVIFDIYGVPEEIRKQKIQKVFNMDYKRIGRRVLAEFKQYVVEKNEQTFQNLLKR